MRMWVEGIGWLGALCVLWAYWGISRRNWASDSFRYQGLNLAGGLCLMANTIYFSAFPSALVNLVWVGIALSSLVSRARA